MSAAQEFARLRARLDDWAPEMIALQRELTARPALAPQNGGDGEWDKADFLAEALDRFGFPACESFPSPDPEAKHGERPNLLVTVPGRAERTLWIVTHLDVVPPGDPGLWDHDPWTVHEQDGRLVGRGVEDNQQGVTSAAFAARTLLAEGVEPACAMGLLFCADEETGCAHGLAHVLREAGGRFRPQDLVIVPDAGTADGTQIEVAEKSVLWLRCEVTGRQAHASTPAAGRNAMRAGAHLVARLDELYDRFGAADPLFDPPASTFEPTKRDANVPNVNTIPGSDRFYVDCRILPDIAVDDVLAAARELADEVAADHDVRIEVAAELRADAAPATPQDAPVVERLRAAVAAVHGATARARGIGGGTFAALLRRAGIPAAVWATQEMTAHRPNESCRVQDMVRDAQVFAHVALAG